jgi:ABC-type multidrug transport system ATPase subunit/pSer/pThr/pTyr-binding forkhead associated (FHA) protein
MDIDATVSTDVRAFLVAVNPALAHGEYVVGSAPTRLGRDASGCAVVVSGDTISRVHAEIRATPSGEFAIEDARSTNGTFVNGQRISGRVVLNEGDRIGLGSAVVIHARFQQQSGRDRAWTLKLPDKESWTIGRAHENDIALGFESTVSSQHAVVRRKNGRLELQDQNSLNGTYVNGRRVKRYSLQGSDVVRIGSTMLRFQLGDDGRVQLIRRDCGGGIALECVGLTRTVKSGHIFSPSTHRILEHVSLAIRPGEFVGLLGPSGAGKSTLLKSLNGFSPPDYGCVLLNETPLYPCYDMFRNTIGYVPQDDIVHSELTVESSLDYVSRLRLPSDVSNEDRRNLIDTTIESLGLSHVRSSRLSQLSGGQRKRVSIGCELITRPSMLFLDEPTSGMDPSTEERLMHIFQDLARNGTTVLITTHILYNLDMLDRIVIMSRGRLVFFGTPPEALEFFGSNDRPVDRPTQIFDILEGECGPIAGAESDDPREAASRFYEREYLASEYYARHIGNAVTGLAGDLLRTIQHPGAPTPSVGPSKSGGQKHAELLQNKKAGRGFSVGGIVSPRAMWTLTKRNIAIKLASPKRALFYLAVPLVLALVTLTLRTEPFPDDAEMVSAKDEIAQQIHGGPIDLGTPIKTLLSPDGASDRRLAEDVVFALKHEGVANLPTPLSILLMMVMTAVFVGTLMSCLELSTERPIFARERMAGQNIVDYLASKLPFLLVLTALQCAVYLGICRFKPELQHFDLVTAYMAMVAMAWAACCMGLFLSALDPAAGQFSVILAIVAVLPQLVFSGGLGPDFYAGMPQPLQWVADALPARWGLEMLTTAFYYHPERSALQWLEEFVPATLGFQFGPGVYYRGAGLLLLQAICWLALCSLFLRRRNAIG